jgi:uncharacterized Fe-S cluster-containing radical SAM superfamily protein
LAGFIFEQIFRLMSLRRRLRIASAAKKTFQSQWFEPRPTRMSGSLFRAPRESLERMRHVERERCRPAVRLLGREPSVHDRGEHAIQMIFVAQ